MMAAPTVWPDLPLRAMEPPGRWLTNKYLVAAQLYLMATVRTNVKYILVTQLIDPKSI